MYLRCPRKYFLRYVRKLKEKPNIHLFRGAAVHEALAKFIESHSLHSHDVEQMKIALIEHFDSAWNSRKQQIYNLGLTKTEIKRFYDDSIQMLLKWLNTYTKGISKGLKKPKTEFKLFSKKHGIMGIIDAIYEHNGKVYLIDYKTGAKDTITRDIKVQIAIYALLYNENLKKMPHTVSIVFLKHQTIKRVKVTDELIHDAMRICKTIHEKTISNDESQYPCICGGWCERDFYGENG
ncbi:RecB family exonuclease [Thermodesulfobacteriota bacterium]